MTLTVGSLFSGIGGLDLGLERAGMRVIWQSEIDPYASRVLKKHWPEVVNHGNIKEINWQKIERPDVICGGYPCQPFSQAGKRRGEEDSRHLWPWVKQAISELRPRYAIMENVRGHLSLGGLSVIAELAAIGYDAEWRVVSAASVGANHRRDRIIIVAYPNDSGSRASKRATYGEWAANEQGWQNQSQFGSCGCSTPLADTDKPRLQGWTSSQDARWQSAERHIGQSSSVMADTTSKRLQGAVREVFKRPGTGFTYSGWQWWETEPELGRVANGVPARVDRLKGLGNAVVPQVAEVIGRLVVAHSCS